MPATYHIKTLKLRLKDKHSAFLRGQARAVNLVWNYCNELCFKHWQRKQEYLSAYDIHPYTKGASKELGLHSQTLQAIQEELGYVRQPTYRAYSAGSYRSR